jgi:HEAT repeat protein
LVFDRTTTREYLVSRRLKRAWEYNPARVWQYLRPRLHTAEWREPILLLSGSFESRKIAMRFINLILKAHSRWEWYLRRDLCLAGMATIERAGLAEDPTPGLISRLEKLFYKKHVSPQARIKIIPLLGQIGAQQVVPVLLQSLEDKDSNVRRVAANVLGEIGDTRALLPLVEMVGDTDWSVHRAATLGLGKIGSLAIPPLLEALRDTGDWRWARALAEIGSQGVIPTLMTEMNSADPCMRRAAAEVLGEIGDHGAIPFLLKALEDGESPVRIAAAQALGQIGCRQTIPALVRALRDDVWRVRREIIKALGEMGDQGDIPLLKNGLDDGDNRVRKEAVESLGKIGGREVIPSLLDMIKDENSQVRGAVAEVFGKIGDQEIVPVLLELLKDGDSLVRWSAATALGDIGNPLVFPVMLEALQDVDKGVRLVVAEALGKIDSPQAFSILSKVLEAGKPYTHEAAVWVLGEIGDSRAVPILIRTLKRGDSRTRGLAAFALGKYGGSKALAALSEALCDKDNSVHQAVTLALDEIWDQQDNSTLRDVLKYDIKLLGKMGNNILEKIGTTSNSINLVKQTARKLYAKKAWRELGPVADRLDSLLSREAQIPDPLLSSPAVPEWFRLLRHIGIGLALVLLLAVISLIKPISSSLEDILKSWMFPWLNLLPIKWVVGVIIASGVIVALLGYGCDVLINKAKEIK